MFVPNALGRMIPEEARGRKLTPYGGVSHKSRLRKGIGEQGRDHEGSKVISLEEAIRANLRSGMTISFHHHLRNGDKVVNAVLTTAARLGIRDLNVAASGIFPVHQPVVDLIREGVVTGIDTSYMGGKVAEAVTDGFLKTPAIFRTHGGRARAIESGELKIDVAFIGASCADDYGNANGVRGKSRFGPLGYAAPDAHMADKVVIVTDNLVRYPAHPISISQKHVDHVVVMDEIGDPAGIVFGTTRITADPEKLRIARTAADVLFCSGLVREGFSFQTGAGGVSLAVGKYVYEEMKASGITGSYGAGGVTSFFVQMLNEGMFDCLLDLQSLDLEAVESLGSNPNHVEVDASFYANPLNKGCWVDKLDIMVLGATEVDVNFNVNVLTRSDGQIMGGSGGHADTAAGARLAVVVVPLCSKTIPRVVKSVTTVVTPGETIDAVITDEGVAVNPRRSDLLQRLQGTGIPLKDISELQEIARVRAGSGEPAGFRGKAEGRIVGLVEYRDGSIIDTVVSVGPR